jgi:hypothetical protein
MIPETIKQSINLYGYLLPNKRVNNWNFARLIKENYSLTNPITLRIYDEVKKHVDLYYTRIPDEGIKITRI